MHRRVESRARARHLIGEIHRPIAAHEVLVPSHAPVGRRLPGLAAQTAAVHHHDRHDDESPFGGIWYCTYIWLTVTSPAARRRRVRAGRRRQPLSSRRRRRSCPGSRSRAACCPPCHAARAQIRTLPSPPTSATRASHQVAPSVPPAGGCYHRRHTEALRHRGSSSHLLDANVQAESVSRCLGAS